MIKYFQGLRINVENPAGSTRSGVDKDGKPWSVIMSYDYGEIVGTNHVDGDPVDVFLGQNKHAKFVYVIHTTKKDGQGFDEDKCFLGFEDAMDAKAAFYKNYDLPDQFYGDMSVLTLAQFKKTLHETKKNPALIRASKLENAIQLHAQGTNPFKVGDPVLVDGMHGRGVVIGIDGRRVTIRFWNREYISRDYIYVHKMSDGDYKSKYSSLHSSIENEGIPEEQGRQGKWIEKVGTQWCIRSNGIDGNFGCWPSREKAEAVMAGKSFIEPDLPKNLLAGGPGSGRHKEALKEYQRIYQLAKQAGHNEKSAHQEATNAYIETFKTLKAGGPGSGRHKLVWTCENCGQGMYQKDINKGRGLTHCKECGEPRPFEDKGLNKWQSPEKERKAAAKDPKQIKLPLKATIGPPHIKFKISSPFKAPQQHGTKPAPSSMNKVGSKHRRPNMPFMEANDWGEPNAGAYQHAHLDTNLWFHPPSLRNPTHIPVDDPGEKDNKYLDVTKRNSKDTKEQRNKLLKRSTPGGSPPLVPVRTTLISPTLNSYMPMYASAGRQRRRMGGGNFRAYGAAKI